MKNTTFVSAGAGSGKTHRLTQDIVRMIREGVCQAEEITLTTYTESAAQELREKVRMALYAEGLFEAAANIDNAVIGTIHSAAHQLVTRYWYLLGISANVSILDEEGSKIFTSQSLSSLPTEDDLKLFDEVLQSFNVTKYDGKKYKSYPDFWKDELKALIGKTYELCISTEQLNGAKEASKRVLQEVFQFNDYNIVVSVLNKVKDIVIALLKEERLTQSARDDFEKHLPIINKHGENIPFPFVSFSKIVGQIAGIKTAAIKKNYVEEIAFASDLADHLPRCRQVKELIERYIDTIFSLAVKWKGLYEQFKRERCLLDYNDLLVNFNKLLFKDEVVADLQSRVKVALVDEYQDCSPLLVKTFDRLSELMTQSVWVGDVKQAIYGFRGTNTLLIQSVIDEVRKKSNGNKFDTLKECWRSNATIVNFVNHLFCEKVFKGQLDKDLICLNLPENHPNPPQDRELMHWHFEQGKESALAMQVKNLIDSGTFKPNEIAVLHKSNEGVKNCVNALKNLGVSYNVKVDRAEQGAETCITAFIHAVVSFAANASNELSKAIILNNIVPGCTASHLLSDRLRYLGQKEKKQPWLENQQVLNRISQIREIINRQCVSEAIETLIVELNLGDLIKRIDASCPAYTYCAALSVAATNYEKQCTDFSLSCSLQGFAQHLHDHPLTPLGDDEGVSVMTYHKSKGLQWPCVILCSLDDEPVNPNKPEKTFCGVITHNTDSETSLYLVPSALSCFAKKLVNAFEKHDVFKAVREATINEARRLMYVGMTRPKEQLILTTYGKGGVNWLTAIGCDPIDASAKEWGGSQWKHSFPDYQATDEVAESSHPTAIRVLKQPMERGSFAKKYISPSKVPPVAGAYTVSQCATFAERLTITSQDNRDSTIGNFLHHAMYLWRGDATLIPQLAKSYGVTVDAQEMESTIRKFEAWMKETYGAPIAIERELPFRYVNERGQEVNGEIDLVYRTPEGDVLVDYKTYQGKVSHLTDPQSDFCASKYSAQIALYEEALQRHGRTLRARLICYLSLGVVVRFE